MLFNIKPIEFKDSADVERFNKLVEEGGWRSGSGSSAEVIESEFYDNPFSTYPIVVDILSDDEDSNYSGKHL